ncbi:hypothetical protein EVU94_04340 [Flavobacteriaceae bacterium 144Ye]|nr:hypothetical protein EVU94_04340 [Flavobacteriaceae bacterium 144Ye]
MRRSKLLSVIIIITSVLSCKPKVDLYLERGLDILSNKKQINFNLYQNIIIEEIGVIRDQKEDTKTLVFKLDNNTNKDDFKNNILGIRVWIIDKNQKKRIENWDFKPILKQVNGYKYIIKEIKVKEDQIKKMKIYMYQNINNKKHKVGDSLMLNKVNTYND